jgi:hypothetical protein
MKVLLLKQTRDSLPVIADAGVAGAAPRKRRCSGCPECRRPGMCCECVALDWQKPLVTQLPSPEHWTFLLVGAGEVAS